MREAGLPRCLAPAHGSRHEQDDRHAGKGRDVPLRGPAEVPADHVGDRMERGAQADPEQCHRQGIGAGRETRKEEHGTNYIDPKGQDLMELFRSLQNKKPPLHRAERA